MMKFFKRFQDLGIEGEKAKYYDRLTREHRMDEMREQARELAKHVKEEDSIPEIAPGAGYLSIELAGLGKYHITGMDMSNDLVEISKRNAKEAGAQIDFQQGNASDMPFQENAFDFIVCILAFKNFKEPGKALDEMCRVLKPEGTALIVDMKRNVSNHDLDNLADQMKVKGLEALFMKLTFKHFLRKGAYTKPEMIALAAGTGFAECVVEEGSVTLSTRLRGTFPKELQYTLDKSLAGN